MTSDNDNGHSDSDNEIEEQLRVTEQIVGRLTTELHKLNQELESKVAEIEVQKGRCKQAHEDHANLEKAYAEIEKQLETAKRDSVILEEAYKGKYVELKEKNDALEEDKKVIMSQLRSEQDRRQAVETELGELKNRQRGFLERLKGLNRRTTAVMMILMTVLAGGVAGWYLKPASRQVAQAPAPAPVAHLAPGTLTTNPQLRPALA